jgi:hypothetical protein
VDVRGIAEQEGASVAESERDAVVDAIGRKPVHLLDVEFEVLESLAPYVLETELAVLGVGEIANGSYQANMSISLEREEKDEVGIFDIDAEVSIFDCLAPCHYIGDIEEAGVRSAREPDTQLTTNR